MDKKFRMLLLLGLFVVQANSGCTARHKSEEEAAKEWESYGDMLEEGQALLAFPNFQCLGMNGLLSMRNKNPS